MDIAARGYANPDLLWSPETLREKCGKPGLVIIDTRPAEKFAKGHILGARHFDLYFVNIDDTDPAPLASFTRMWANLLGWRGVSEGDTIVFVGEFTDMCGARGFGSRNILATRMYMYWTVEWRAGQRLALRWIPNATRRSRLSLCIRLHQNG